MDDPIVEFATTDRKITDYFLHRLVRTGKISAYFSDKSTIHVTVRTAQARAETAGGVDRRAGARWANVVEPRRGCPYRPMTVVASGVAAHSPGSIDRRTAPPPDPRRACRERN